jgi:hypothetical protein
MLNVTQGNCVTLLVVFQSDGCAYVFEAYRNSYGFSVDARSTELPGLDGRP